MVTNLKIKDKEIQQLTDQLSSEPQGNNQTTDTVRSLYRRHCWLFVGIDRKTHFQLHAT